jgi:hypothetical protein
LLYDCDHKILAKEFKVETVLVTRGPSRTDPLPVKNVAAVSDILAGDGATIISPEIYNMYSDSIVWVKQHNPDVPGKYRTPAPGEVYQVTLKYFDILYTRYDASECIRCNGNGWYNAPLVPGTSLNYLRGPYLVAQEFLKVLFTIPGTDRLDENYGSGLITNTGIVNFDASLINHIKTCINIAETRCKEQYISDPNRSYNEILEKVIIDSITTNEQLGGIVVYLTLLTAAGNKLRLSLQA